MQAIWVSGCGTVKDFITNLKCDNPPPYTTAASIVRNLERKGYVTIKKYGNTNVYTPSISIDEYKQAFMGGVVRDYFTNSYRDVVSFFVEQKHISREELRELLELIDKEEK